MSHLTPKPGVVLVHGSWHRPWHLHTMLAKLHAQGYPVMRPYLPSCHDAANAATKDAFAMDVAEVKQAILSTISFKRDAIVIMHSYAGACGSDAVAEACEEASEKHGRIVRLIYICAMIHEKGTSVADQGYDRSATEHREGLTYRLDPARSFYNTTDPDTVFHAVRRLLPMAASASAGVSNYRGWADYGIPVTYIATLQDNALPYDPFQLRFCKRIEDAGVRDFTKYTIDCDHTPWLSSGKDEFFRILAHVLGETAWVLPPHLAAANLNIDPAYYGLPR